MGRHLDGRALLASQTATRSVLFRIAAALTGLSLAYVGARWAMVEFAGGGEVDVSVLARELGIFLVLATAGLTFTSAMPIRKDLIDIGRLIEHNEEELRSRNRGQRFLRRVQTAFEMAETDAELYAITGEAMRAAADHPGEILVADSSLAHLERLVTTAGHAGPGCGVATPRNCPAVRNGQTLRFSNANDLDACPRLRERGLPDSHASVCVPVNVLGTPSAVLHAGRDSTGATVDELEANVVALEGVAVRFGARLGMMRAMSQTKLQADTDPLTGLLNRRAMENRVRELRSDHPSFTVAMADLDHFKDLNDTFGHDTGDRALRLFSRVLQTTMRDADLVSRHGGEEFLLVLPDVDASSAPPILDRIRARLAAELAGAQLPPFTVSLGLCDSTASSDFSEMINFADRALMQAKTDGRDRVVIWDPSMPATVTFGSNADDDSADTTSRRPPEAGDLVTQT